MYICVHIYVCCVYVHCLGVNVCWDTHVGYNHVSADRVSHGGSMHKQTLCMHTYIAIMSVISTHHIWRY